MFGSKKNAKGDGAIQAAPTPPGAAPPGPASVAAPPALAGSGEPPQPSAAQAEQAGQIIRQALAFTQIVSVLMRSPLYKHYALSDLEWLVMPPIVTGQYSVAEIKAANSPAGLPAAIALWANVSPEVDRRLSENPNAPMRLRPDEWRSGELAWLIAVIGDPRVVPQLLKNLGDTSFKGREVRTRSRGPDGVAKVTVVPASGDGAAFAQAVMGPAAPPPAG